MFDSKMCFRGCIYVIVTIVLIFGARSLWDVMHTDIKRNIGEKQYDLLPNEVKTFKYNGDTYVIGVIEERYSELCGDTTGLFLKNNNISKYTLIEEMNCSTDGLNNKYVKQFENNLYILDTSNSKLTIFTLNKLNTTKEEKYLTLENPDKFSNFENLNMVDKDNIYLDGYRKNSKSLNFVCSLDNFICKES